MKLFVVGSGDDSHIKFTSPFVSNYHAELLFLDNGDILLTDKGSKNGTFLNDRKLRPNADIPVKRGDVIRFADKELDWNDVPNVPMPDLTKIKEMKSIGTNFRNKIQIQGDKVSRFHATLIKKNDNVWYIQDHSRNGTTVNGQRIPSDVNIKLKKRDNILCAGVQIENPYGNSVTFNYRKIAVAAFSILILCGITFGSFHMIRSCKKGEKIDIYENGTLSDVEIYSKYKSSTVMLIGFYYYKVTAGILNLEEVLGLPSSVAGINRKSGPIPVNKRTDMNMYTGTGFFISEDGKIATNLHIARPWAYKEDEMELIKTFYGMQISDAAAMYPKLGAFTSQVKVEGVLDYIGIITNGSYFSEENIKTCRELYVPDNKEEDVAVMQIDSKRLPDGVTNIVDINKAVLLDQDIRVGSHIYTMGFPFGLNIQDLKSSKGIQLRASDGSITQECTEYSFGFNATSYGGASGSPLFNNKGQLIGILNAGVTSSQGFIFAMKPVFIKNLLDKFGQ